MKIVITSQGSGPDAELDPRFGRAKTLVSYDTESGEFDTVDNAEVASAVQGAGIQAAANVARLGVRCLITGSCGPKAFRALSAAGVRVMLCSGGTVRSAIEKFEAGGLVEAEGPNAEGHGS